MENNGIVVRVELLDLNSDHKYERRGKKLIIEDMFNHHSAKRLSCLYTSVITKWQTGTIELPKIFNAT